MENQQPSLSIYDEDDSHRQTFMSNQVSASLSKSTSNLPPASNQSRVARIKTAIAVKDDDLERAQDLKTSQVQNQPQQRSTLSRVSSQNLIDQECEKLKESYSQHRRRKNDQSRERSKSGVRNNNSRSIGRQSLIADSSLGQNLDKENSQMRNSVTSSTFQNRYKRNQSNNKSLQNYQEKYNKLEENFKKFTQGLQDKRTTSASGRLAFQTINQSSFTPTTANQASSYMPAAAPQPSNQNSFGPIRSETSPIRQRKTTAFQAAQLDISRQFNPLGLSQTVTHHQVRASHLKVDKSLHLGELLGGQTGFNAPSAFMSLDNIPEGASRLQMLHNLVTRMNHFMETCFNKLVSLCISKQQEKQLQELQTRVIHLVHQTSTSVQRITQEDSTELADESMKVKEIYRLCVENLQNCFQEILTRIYQVESETFKSYKFKDTMAALELILQESHRLNLYQLLPQLIDNLKLRKIQAAAGMLQSQFTKRKMMLQKHSFVSWRNKVGLNHFLTRTFAKANFSKVVHRLVSNWSQRSTSRYLHLWRQILFNRKQQIEANSQGGSIVEKILLDHQKFNDSLQEDASLAIHLSSQVKDMFGDFCDIQFISTEDISANDDSREENQPNFVEAITGFDYEHGQPRTVVIKAIENNSITGLSLKRTSRGDGSIRLTSAIFSNTIFNEQVDTPLLPKTFLCSRSFQDLEMLALPLYDENQQLIGLLRVFTASRFTEDMQSVYAKASTAIGSFCARMQNLRGSLQSLHRDIKVKNEQIELHGIESCVHSCLFDILDGLQEGTKSDFTVMLLARSNKMLHTLLPGLRLRQIYHKIRDRKDKFVLQKIVQRSILGDDETSGTQCLVRQRDHKVEKEQLLEDFLDYHQEKITHQVSIESDSFNFVLHRDLPKGNFFIKQTLNENLKFAVTLFTQCLQPVLLQGLKIHEELALQVKGQARELVRQVSLNTTKEELRSLIGQMVGLKEQESHEQFNVSVQTCLNNSDLMGEVQVVSFSSMLNTGLLTGQPLNQAEMFAFQTPKQNEMLQMPERLDIQFAHSDEQQQLAKYQASASEYSHIRQEMQVRDQKNIYIVLPICSDSNLLALIKMEMVISDEDTDKQSTVQDVKALVATIQLEAQKSLTQIVYAQANQNLNFKECLDHLQAQISNLTIDLDFSQAVLDNLVLPFTQAPSAKVLGLALTRLSDKILPQLELQAIALCLDGREVITDIRLLDWRYIMNDHATGYGIESRSGPLAFNIQDRTICVSIQGDTERRGLNMRFILTKKLGKEAREQATDFTSEDLSQSGPHDFILQQCKLFQLIVTPFVQTAMSSLSMTALIPPKQEQLPRVLSKIVMQRKYSHIYNFFMRLKELQVNKVPIFTRLASYRHIVRSKYDSWGIDTQIGYGQEAKKEYLIREKVLLIYANTFKSLNILAKKIKESYFSQLKNQVLAQMAQEQATLQYRAAFQPTKLMRKSLGIIFKQAKKMALKAYFTKFAIQTNKFSRLNNPILKEMGAALCIFANFLRMKQRRAFQRMRANAAQVYFRDFAGAEVRDRERLIALTRTLLETNLNVQDASHHLEEAVTSVLEQALTYLQEQMCQESLDLIVCTIQQPNTRKARAYTFQNKIVNNKRMRQITRVADNEVIDGVTSANIEMFVDGNIVDFNVNFKRDVILQMLAKSQTAFNFNNISQSLYDLYQNRLGQVAATRHGSIGPGSALASQTVDLDTAKRMIIVKKSKSSLLIPLLVPFRPQGGDDDAPFYNTGVCVPEFRLIGSLELYKYHFQPFDEELERRIGIFAKILANDVLPIYFSLRQTQLQIDSLRKQVQRNSLPVTSLTTLLRQIYCNGPTQLNASSVLPIIIDQSTQTASFFQFKDNHIYNFQYQNTFIGELVNMACILELASSDQPVQNTEPDLDETDASNTERSNQYWLGEASFLHPSHSNVSISLAKHKRRSLDAGQIKSITNEKFAHILYYPVVIGALGRTKAVVEVCFNDKRKVPANVITNQIHGFLETFGGQLNSLESRIRTFCKFTDSSITRRDSIKKTKYFQEWKTSVQLETQRRQFVQNQKQTINQTEQCFSEYVKSLESYDNELKKIVVEREELKQNLASVNLDRTAKYKFLGASLIILANTEKIQKRNLQREAFNKWRYSQSVSKIAEKAFNKILELNHRHSNQRFDSACFLLTKSLGKIIKKDAIEKICQYATMTQLRHHRQKNYAGSSFRTSMDVTAISNHAHYDSRKSGDKLSNIVRMGIQIGSGSTSMVNLNPTPSVPQHTVKHANQNMTVQRPSGHTSFMTPNINTSRTYDSQIQSFGVQMGFGAVPSRVPTSSQGQKKRRSKSRSTSQRRSLTQK